MNDRYLYKAKRKHDSKFFKKGEWVDGAYYIEPYTDKCFIIQWNSTGLGFNEFIEVYGESVCQCTGLKDKNGKLIWENDIMVAHLDDRFPEDATYTRVVWNNNGFCTKEQVSEDIFPLDKFDQENFEVCGNLFDNPELLEVGE